MDNNESLVKMILDRKGKIAESNSLVSVWNCWYKGFVPDFHPYKIYHGNSTIDMCLLSMHMAKKVCQDWASLIMNEKVSIGVSNQDLLEKLLMQIDFYNKANKSVEYAWALSMSALVVDIEDLEVEQVEGEILQRVNVTKDTKITASVYSAFKIVPITFTNNEVTECAFVQENTDSKKITIHTIDDETKTYNIIVYKLDKDNNITSCYKIVTKSKTPFFVIVHPQLVNNFDLDSQYPISIFANAIDTLKSIDIMFDSYANEFNLGRKRIFVSTELDTVDKTTGLVKKTFDPHDVVIHQLPPLMSANGQEKPLIYEANGQLRVAEHSQAIQDLLNYFSSQCELGVDYYRFEKGRVMTATQVISEKSDTFRNLKKHEGVFEKSLHTFITALQYAYNEFTINNEKFNDIENITIHFDDSIIEDKNTEKTNDQKDVEFGAMSLVAYRMKWFAEDEQKATEEMKKIYGDADFLKRLANFSPFLTQGVLTPLQFVKMVYIDIKNESEQIALAEEIKESMKSGDNVFDDITPMDLRIPTNKGQE